MTKLTSANRILLSPGFLMGLGILLLNDFYLKAAFHNGLTGKLSDVAGLFIFPLFFAAFFARQKKSIYIFTTLLFAFWKSALSSTMLATWNQIGWLQFDRVVDYADLFAIFILPISYWYFLTHLKVAKCRSAGACTYGQFSCYKYAAPLALIFSTILRGRKLQIFQNALTVVVCTIAVFAFTATSMAKRTITVQKEYEFDCTQKELVRRMGLLSGQENLHKEFNTEPMPTSCSVDLRKTWSEAFFIVSEFRNKSKISLMKFEVSRSEKKDDLISEFEIDFITKLTDQNPAPSETIKYIRALYFDRPQANAPPPPMPPPVPKT